MSFSLRNYHDLPGRYGCPCWDMEDDYPHGCHECRIMALLKEVDKMPGTGLRCRDWELVLNDLLAIGQGSPYDPLYDAVFDATCAVYKHCLERAQKQVDEYRKTRNQKKARRRKATHGLDDPVMVRRDGAALKRHYQPYFDKCARLRAIAHANPWIVPTNAHTEKLDGSPPAVGARTTTMCSTDTGTSAVDARTTTTTMCGTDTGTSTADARTTTTTMCSTDTGTSAVDARTTADA
jgi:hypothetical protein